MHIELDEGPVADAAKAVDLAGFDDQNVTRSGFELLPVHGPHTAAFPHELDLIVRMAMGSGTASREGAEEEYGDTHVALLGPDELVRAPLKGQVLLTDAVHRGRLLTECGAAVPELRGARTGSKAQRP
jgi:hypothetical protein